MSPPTTSELRIVRILVWIGLFFIGRFLFWFFSGEHQGHALLYWPLTLATLTLIAGLLSEWYYYYRITFPKTLPKREISPTVDVFTTYCPGEPKEMVIRTLAAIQRIAYPHSTYLCDEANDAELKNYCQASGIHHVTRNNRIDAKAGNINNALTQAQGELCLILDPDHIPNTTFLDRLVPYFQDPQVGFVQSVQAYYNQGESYVAKGAAQQTYLFYGPLMLGMNGYGTVPAIGANCLFRRAALDSIGGHANGLAEDMHTSLQLHAQGWKSVFHPEILARGLAPSTLSAYYQQQIKWSKGTWDIMLHSFIEQFRKLRWTQRLHYGSASLFYLLGFVYLINFLVPILSLTTSRFPWRVDIGEFVELAAPIIAQIFFIRHYVQKWVFEETERGLHMVGGLLFINSWWVYCLGVLYAIFRVPVPYLPTPKQHHTHSDVRLHLPNLLLMFVSVFAIGYGLRVDWSPYTLFMAGFALTNVLILSAGIGFSYPLTFQQDGFTTRLIQQLIAPGKAFLWKLRHAVYSFVRRYAFFLCLLLIALVLFSESRWTREPTITVKQTGPHRSLSGGFLTASDHVSPKALSGFPIMALEVDGQSSSLADSLSVLIATAQAAGKLPYFSWVFTAEQVADTTLYSSIVGGAYDDQLDAMQRVIRTSGEPVFLHPQLPAPALSQSPVAATFTAASYLKAWQYLHDRFQEQNYHRIIWVWQAPDSLPGSCFPGHEYVDWIAISRDQHTHLAEASLLHSLRPPLPPFLLYDTTRVGENNPDYSDHAVANAMVRAQVSVSDERLPSGLTHPSGFSTKVYRTPLDTAQATVKDTAKQATPKWPGGGEVDRFLVKGVAYTPFDVEKGAPSPLTRRLIEKDFARIKAMGANTIRRYTSDIFDRNVVTYAEEVGLKVIFGLDLPPSLDYHADTLAKQALEESVLSTIVDFKEAPSILAWNLGNKTYAELDQHFAKPYLFAVRRSYLSFIDQLSAKIHQLDPRHPVMDAILQDKYFALVLKDYQRLAPHLDMYGFDTYREDWIPRLDSVYRALAINKPYLISAFGPSDYWDTYQAERQLLDLVPEPSAQVKAQQYARLWSQDIVSLRGPHRGGVAFRWQDQFSGSVTWNGVVDFKGRPTPIYYALQKAWQTGSPYHPDYDVQIIWQGQRLLPGFPYQINALVRHHRVAEITPSEAYQYEWYVHEEDAYGSIRALYPIGDYQASFRWQAPSQAGRYRLYLFVQPREGGLVVSASSPFVIY